MIIVEKSMLPLKSKGSSRWIYYPLGVVETAGGCEPLWPARRPLAGSLCIGPSAAPPSRHSHTDLRLLIAVIGPEQAAASRSGRQAAIRGQPLHGTYSGSASLRSALALLGPQRESHPLHGSNSLPSTDERKKRPRPLFRSWWRRWELNPCPNIYPEEFLRAQPLV